MFRIDISGTGFLDIGLGILDKVNIYNGKLVNIDLYDLYAVIKYNGNLYIIKNGNEVWDIETNSAIKNEYTLQEKSKDNKRYYYLNGVKTLLD